MAPKTGQIIMTSHPTPHVKVPITRLAICQKSACLAWWWMKSDSWSTS